MKDLYNCNSGDFIADIKQIIEQSRKQAYVSVNAIMIRSYWLLGKRIVEEEQGGDSRAEYGKFLLTNLANELTAIYGNAYSVRRLREYRQLYVYFSDLEMCYPLTSLVNYDYEEYKPILDDAEREYLQKYVMDNPAFKGRVKYIKKSPVYYKKAQFLEIETTYDDYAYLPYFKEDSMYKGMELEKEYTAQELGLKE